MPTSNLMDLRQRLAGTPRRKLVTSVVAIALLAGAAAAVWRFMQASTTPSPHFVEVASNTYILPKPDALADFRLLRHDDAQFDNNSLKGRWSFLIFGYTFCPDFCPTTLAVFNEIHTQLAQRRDGVRDLQFVMVSVDPERDTTKLLSQYVPHFNREFIGVTGDAAVIARLADSAGAVYTKHPGKSDESYLIDHSSAVLLINPQGRLQGVFAAPHVATDMVQGFLKIREKVGAVAQAGSLADQSPLKVSAR